ncbi:hypothetical protein [Helicobacter cetorum]|uniref:Uncharacterized protein n=1 Tax=Helicobacter cetorum (strain ATCC BAA-540 / CCUG 52418 / MIT 99-5656) TaxID=1163745 RepID=I0ES32_HELCM|nr:hypothetical protein [Helicobacter cetorum]AFI05751.1 hypothetical protein HCD_03675 [Helicobacter cetorum MIT 99-5656]
MLKRLLLVLLFLGFLRAEADLGHYEIIAELSKAFLKAKNAFTMLNQTLKTCVETEDDATQIRIQSAFLGSLSSSEQQFYDYFEQGFKSIENLKTLLKNIESLEESSSKIPCAIQKNAKNFEILDEVMVQIIDLEEQMDRFINNTK